MNSSELSPAGEPGAGEPGAAVLKTPPTGLEPARPPRWNSALMWLVKALPELLALTLAPFLIEYVWLRLILIAPAGIFDLTAAIDLNHYYFFLPLLLLAWTRIGQTSYLALTWGWVTVPMASIAFAYTLSYLREIDQDLRQLGPLYPGILPEARLVMTWELSRALEASAWPIAFLSGVFCARRKFAYWKYALGFFPAALAMNWLLDWRTLWRLPPALDTAMLLGLGSFPILLPRTRRGLERLFGFSLGSREPIDCAKPSWLARWLAYSAIAALILSLPFTALLGYVTRVSYDAMFFGVVEPVHRSPALRNVYDDWKNEFEGAGPLAKNPDKHGVLLDNIPALKSLLKPSPPELVMETITAVGAQQILEILQTRSSYIESIERARHADYLDWPAGHSLSFGPLRDALRTIRLRAFLRIHQNRPEDAIQDIETLYHAGRLLHGHDIVNTMIGVAARRIADEAAYQYLAIHRNDPAKLALLADCLHRVAPMVRRSMDIEGMRRREPGLRRVSIDPELTINLSARSVGQYYWQWAQFDTLELATALELHRHKHGAYPDKLDALAPEFLPRLPLDPWNGKAYRYEILGDKFGLNCDALNPPALAQIVSNAGLAPLFPNGAPDNPELREELAKLREAQ